MNYKNYFKIKLFENVERYHDDPPTLETDDGTLQRYYPGSRGDRRDFFDLHTIDFYGSPGGPIRIRQDLPWKGWPNNLPSAEEWQTMHPWKLWKYIPSWHPMWNRYPSLFPNGKPTDPNSIPTWLRWVDRGDGNGRWEDFRLM
jgi:hypothetical protein